MSHYSRAEMLIIHELEDLLQEQTVSHYLTADECREARAIIESLIKQLKGK